LAICAAWRWSEAIAALDTGHIHGSGSENNILRIAASLGDPGIPVQLACVLGNLDLTNIGPITNAISRATGSDAGPGQHPVSEARRPSSDHANTERHQTNTSQSDVLHHNPQVILT
jgi:hypothetical protein